MSKETTKSEYGEAVQENVNKIIQKQCEVACNEAIEKTRLDLSPKARLDIDYGLGRHSYKLGLIRS